MFVLHPVCHSKKTNNPKKIVGLTPSSAQLIAQATYLTWYFLVGQDSSASASVNVS